MSKRKAGVVAGAPMNPAPPPAGGGLFAGVLAAPPPAAAAPALAALFSAEANAYVRPAGERLGAANKKKPKLVPVRRGDGGPTPATPDRVAQAARAAAAAAAARAADAARGGGRTRGVPGLGGRAADLSEGEGEAEVEDEATASDATASASTSSSGSEGGEVEADGGESGSGASSLSSDDEGNDAASSEDDSAPAKKAAAAAPARPPLPPRDPAAEAGRLARTVFVSNVAASTKRKALAATFSAYGPVEAVRLRSVALSDKGKAAADRHVAVLMAGGRKGGAASAAGAAAQGKNADENTAAAGGAHAYVVFTSPSSAKAALAHNMRTIGGLHVRVDMAAPPRRSAADAWAGKVGGDSGGATTPSSPRPAFDKARSVFVGNLPPGIADEALITAFGGPHVAGEDDGGCVTAVRCVRDARTGEGRGVAFVELADRGAAAAALARDGTLLGGRPLRVTRVKDAAAVEAAKKARARREAPLAAAGRGGGGREGGGGRGTGGGRGGRGGFGRGGFTGGRGGPTPPPASFQGVRTKGRGGKVSGGAASAPRAVRGGRGAGRAGGRSGGLGGHDGGQGRGRSPAAGPREGKRPSVAARKEGAGK